MQAPAGDFAETPPLILTLEVDAQSFAHFDAMRRRHFPAHRNQIPAHLTLFHKLPGEEAPAISSYIEEICAQQPPIELEVNDVMLLGRGVAFRLQAEALQELHRELASAWRAWLTRQDEQGFRPHIVVQNKVEPATARALYEQLAGSFRPWSVTGTGLHLWQYLDGPWRSMRLVPFRQT